MALGIVPVADDWGVNSEIIDNGKNGFLIYDDNDWDQILRNVLGNTILRNQIALKAKIDLQRKYSLESAFPILLNTINNVLDK